MSRMTMGLALNEAIRREMKRDERVFCIGEDIGVMGGSFGVTRDLLDEFGPMRVIDTPISEQMLIGASVGAAALGMVPVVEIMFSDFMASCFDQLMNQAAKMRYMYGGNTKLPMVVRFPGGGGIQAAAQHSQNLEALLTHIPGLKVVYPSCAADAAGLMVSAIRDENPVMFFEHKCLYGAGSTVEESDFEPIPFGKAAIKHEGTDVTVVTTGQYVNRVVKLAKKLEKEGISVEVIDPRTLFPLDTETIYKSVEKTHKFMVVTEECKRCAWSAEIASLVAEYRFNALEKPIVRIGSLNVPTPFSGNLEDYVMPREEDIVAGIKSLL